MAEFWHLTGQAAAVRPAHRAVDGGRKPTWTRWSSGVIGLPPCLAGSGRPGGAPRGRRPAVLPPTAGVISNPRRQRGGRRSC